MIKKAVMINDLYNETLNNIFSDEHQWVAFLKTAGQNYKYNFNDQVLIYAQKPNAVACAEIELWNTKFNRWVNRGANGIALLKEHYGAVQLRHVFDVSDTNSKNKIEFKTWRVKPEYQDSVIEAVKKYSNNESSEISFGDSIKLLAANVVDGDFDNYRNNIIGTLDESSINHEDALREVTVNSVAYMVLTRCGYNANDYFSTNDFENIKLFNFKRTSNALGCSLNDYVNTAINPIHKTIIDLERMLSNEKHNNLLTTRELQSSEYRSAGNEANHPGEVRNDEKKLPEGIQEGTVYRAVDGRSIAATSVVDRQTGNGKNDDDNITTDGETRSYGGTESERSDEVGGDDEQYPSLGRRSDPERTDLRLEHWDRDNEDKSLPFLKRNYDNEIINGTPHLKATKQEIINYFETHDAVSDKAKYIKNTFNNDYTELIIRNDERVGYKTYDNGLLMWTGSYLNRTSQACYDWTVVASHIEGMILVDEFFDKQKPLPSYSQQMTLLSNPIQNNDFKFSQKVIDTVLQRGSNIEHGKYRIYEQFQKKQPIKVNAAFLSEEYGWGGCYPIITGANIDEMHDGKGLSLTRGETKLLLPWNNVAKRIGELIEVDRYLSDKEKQEYPSYLKHIEEQRQIHEEERLAKDILLHVPVDNNIEDNALASYQYGVGDTVYIGIDEYEIAAINNDTVRLHDVKYPLLSEEYDRADFDKKVRENTENDYLKVIGRPEINVDTSENSIPEDVIEQPAVETENNIIVPKWEQTSKVKETYEINPEVKQSERRNFCITDNDLGIGGAKQKFRNNINAIQTLQKCESENRLATTEEQQVLFRYVGWGGLSDAFDDSKTAWSNEYNELLTILSQDEYSSARESTLTAFYTPPIVIKSIYNGLEHMGFRNGNIIDPACGTGNFIGLLPESMQESKFYGVEIDSLSGRIARQLYQKSNIAVKGFEKVDLPDSLFDVAIGNVPFGQFKVSDKRYDKNNFLIHDYFFAKALDKVRPGGIVAFITSKGTLDKQNPSVRKYIAQRAELLGAIRLPNNAFSLNAGTDVTSDIIFLQKRDRLINAEPDWIDLGMDENGIVINQYFIDNPAMIMGDMVMQSTQYGMDSTCKPYEGQSLEVMLSNAVSNINAVIDERITDDYNNNEDYSIPADPNVKNFSYTLVDGKIYFRENSRMNPVEISGAAEMRIKGMIEIMDCLRSLISMQTEDYPDFEINSEQEKLNQLYDTFTEKYGIINSKANNSAFGDDNSYCLLCSLEIINEDGELVRKADMFTKRTIKPHKAVTSVDTSSEALAVSISEKACVDIDFMSGLVNKTPEEIEKDLTGVIFRDPGLLSVGDIPKSFVDISKWKLVTADEYLSGNVRQKLAVAQGLSETSHELANKLESNINALKVVQPIELKASEISVRLSASWLPTEDIETFMFELLKTPRYTQWNIHVKYSEYTSEWNIEGKSQDRMNVMANNTYGTNRVNAYKIIEETLNLHDVRIYDYVEDSDGKKTQVLNKKETAIAQSKQELIKSEFVEWIWNDVDRRERLSKLYNEKFNSIKPREYDGSHLTLEGINPEIQLRPHQVNAVARVLYGGNTLLAHVVGAGKTYEMIAAAQESKRLGLCNKSMFVVPNHLTEQWATEYLQLYPAANILVTTKKDFETKNRKKFCGRIATGDYDAVIIGHSQFEKIPMSADRQKEIINNQLNGLTEGIADLKANDGERFSIKQLEKTKKSLMTKLDKLNDQSRKDDVVTFEELGIDRIFVDEAHNFKNLFLYTKMRNVGGIAQTEAQKSSDLFMKCQYLDETTVGRGVIFATGTPISNSMTELYTMQRYLQYNSLVKNHLQHFDAWASTFGETVTAIELAPEGTGYRAKTRFAKFYNLPELMSMFKEVADIQTADMLNLPVPKANYNNISVKPSDVQADMVESLSDRADAVRNKQVDSSVDNMLLITNDGRKLALDQRLINEMLPENEHGKVNACIDNVFKLWEENAEEKLTQLIFCDLSTPKNDGHFNVYEEIKKKLLEKGIPESEVAFIHDANTEQKKKELFAKVRSGDVRVLIGSTTKMGAGTNVQDKLISIHDLDCPWRPSDVGRVLRTHFNNYNKKKQPTLKQ